MPYKLAFLDFENGDAWYFLDVIANICFFIDLFVNSFTAFYDDDGNLIIQNKAIFARYFKSWFFWDILACMPITIL